MTREHRGSVELVRSSNECIGDVEAGSPAGQPRWGASQPRKRSVVQISASRPGHFASIIDSPFAKLIRGCWFATVVVMSERSPDQIHEQIRELLDSLYRVDSGRILATLIRLLGDFDLAEEAMHEAFAAALSLWPRSGVPGVMTTVAVNPGCLANPRKS